MRFHTAVNQVAGQRPRVPTPDIGRGTRRTYRFGPGSLDLQRAKLNGSQPDRRLCFTYLNGRDRAASGRVQLPLRILGTAIGKGPTDVLNREMSPPKGRTMLTKLTAAVLAATIMLGPALAAETGTPPIPSANPATQQSTPAKHVKVSHHLRHRRVAHPMGNPHRMKHVVHHIRHPHPTNRIATQNQVKPAKD